MNATDILMNGKAREEICRQCAHLLLNEETNVIVFSSADQLWRHKQCAENAKKVASIILHVYVYSAVLVYEEIKQEETKRDERR